MTEAAARLADVLYGIYRDYAALRAIPAAAALAAAEQHVQKMVALLATIIDTMLRNLAEKERG